MRLNQFLAQNSGLSRRKADEYIQQGLVEVNGDLGQIGQQVTESDKVRYFQHHEWKTVQQGNPNQILLFYKPIFTVTTRDDPQKRRTVYDHLPKVYSKLKPVGRLDYMSEGLLVLASDGELIYKLTHPSQNSRKTYLIGLKSPLQKQDIEIMEAGKMQLEGYALRPIKVTQFFPEQDTKYAFLKLQPNFVWYTFELQEGRNNQIRQMCEQFGQKVFRLVRLQHGPFSLTEELHTKKYLEA